MSEIVEVAGFGVALDRAYDPDRHFWVSTVGPDRARIGMDALGVETSGTLAQLAFLPVGEYLKRGDAFGSLEAAKFVGPLTCPLSGRWRRPTTTSSPTPPWWSATPMAPDGWWSSTSPTRPSCGDLISGADVIRIWFEAEVEDYRMKGVLAE